MHCLVDGIQATRYPRVALYPSSYLWDGPSRGDYHVGSNVAVWTVFQTGARLAGDLWGDAETAADWSAQADLVRAAILEKGIFDGYFDDQFAEGTLADGAVTDDVTCHDGEEIMVGDAAVFSFVEADDLRRTRHGTSGMSTQNPFYEPALDGLYWGEGAPVTAPGWLTALSGATSEDGRQRAIQVFRSHTDVDGSMWW